MATTGLAAPLRGPLRGSCSASAVTGVAAVDDITCRSLLTLIDGAAAMTTAFDQQLRIHSELKLRSIRVSRRYRRFKVLVEELKC